MKLRLSDIYELQMGKTPARNTPAFWNGTNAWVSISDLTSSDKYISQTRECITDDAITRTGIKKVPKDTLLMSFKLSLGKVAITAADIYTNEAIMAFIDKKTHDVDIHYMYHYFQAIDWTIGTNKAVKGVTLNKIVLSEKVIELPPINIQHEIAERMDNLNAVTKNLQRQLTLVDELVKSQFVEMFGDPVTNPMGWEKVPLSELAEIRIGPLGTLLHKEDYIEGGHPLVNPSHIYDGNIVTDSELTISDEKYEELSAYHLYENDVVMGRRGEMGRCAVVTDSGLLCGTGSMIIRPLGEVRADFLQKIISFPSFKKMIKYMAVGQTMPNLNVPIVSRLEIIKPLSDVQDAYYDFVALADKSKLVLRQLLEKQQTLKAALMQEYFAVH